VALRLFVAVDLSDEAKRALSGLLSRLKGLDSGVRWVAPENLHVTLKFLGNVEEGKVEAIRGALSGALSGFKPFAIRLKGLGAFPSAKRPRVVWMGVEEGNEELSALARAVEVALERLGFPREGREFVAHVTLGRVKSRASGGLLRFLERPEGIPEVRQEVREVVLMRSVLRPEGPEYTPLFKFPLGGRGAGREV